jgi:hypothetical protein
MAIDELLTSRNKLPGRSETETVNPPGVSASRFDFESHLPQWNVIYRESQADFQARKVVVLHHLLSKDDSPELLMNVKCSNDRKIS